MSPEIFMKTAIRFFLALVASAASCFGIWVAVMEVGLSQMGLALPICILLMATASLIVGFGLGARTFLLPARGGILVVLFGIIAVTPLLLWERGRIAADPGMHKLWPVDYALILVTVFVPCVIGMVAFRMMAARAGIGPGCRVSGEPEC
jgi:hypothetical protein